MKKYTGGSNWAPKIKEAIASLRETEEDQGGLEKTIKVIPLVSLIVALFFLSPIVTGNAIGSLVNSTTNIIGAGLIVCGLVGAYLLMKK
jgi:hypothetical protein